MTSGDGLSFIEARYIERSPAGRVCAREGCGAVLSRYNHGTYCHAHWRDGEDDPERMSYSGYTLAHCPVCDEVKTLRDFRAELHMCRACAKAHRYGGDFKRCKGHDRPEHVTADFGSHHSLCRECYASYRRERRRELKKAVSS